MGSVTPIEALRAWVDEHGTIDVRRAVVRRVLVRRTSTRFPDSGGRFGGGWDWKVGVQATKRFDRVIVSCLFFEVYLRRGRPR